MMKIYLSIVGLLVSLSVIAAEVQPDKVITMGYRSTEKLPYIAAAPANEGFYKDLYSEAAQRIGYQLKIERKPKKRILRELEEGLIDFYPGFSFKPDRAEYSFWIRNGIIQRDIVISKDSLADLKSATDINQLSYLVSLGNPDQLDKTKHQAERIEVPELGVERAIELIKRGNADFYIYEEDTLKYFVKSNQIQGMKFHENLIEQVYYSHAGFSRLSPLFQGQDNALYEVNQAQSIANFPWVLAPDSPIQQFEQALWQMHEEGFTKNLYQQYFE